MVGHETSSYNAMLSLFTDEGRMIMSADGLSSYSGHMKRL